MTRLVSDSYPEKPGVKGTHSSGFAAAEKMQNVSTKLRRLIIDRFMKEIRAQPDFHWPRPPRILPVSSAIERVTFTADEMAVDLDIDIGSIRPRFSELYLKHLVVKTGKRRPSIRGNPQTVYRLNIRLARWIIKKEANNAPRPTIQRDAEPADSRPSEDNR